MAGMVGLYGGEVVLGKVGVGRGSGGGNGGEERPVRKISPG